MRENRRRVLTQEGAGQFEVREEEIPELRPGTVLIEVKSSLISPGTELASTAAWREVPDPEQGDEPFGYGNPTFVLLHGPVPAITPRPGSTGMTIPRSSWNGQRGGTWRSARGRPGTDDLILPPSLLTGSPLNVGRKRVNCLFKAPTGHLG